MKQLCESGAVIFGLPTLFFSFSFSFSLGLALHIYTLYGTLGLAAVAVSLHRTDGRTIRTDIMNEKLVNISNR